jgi:putative endonuclease
MLFLMSRQTFSTDCPPSSAPQAGISRGSSRSSRVFCFAKRIEGGFFLKYFYVYILKCADKSYYIGHTDDLERRLSEHKTGYYFGYTSIRLPVEVVSVRSFATRDEAFAFERKIKNWSRVKKEAFIKGDWNMLSEAGKKKFGS